MSQENLTTDDLTARAADWVSTALSIPLVWPKMTALGSLAIIGLTTALCIAPRFQSDKPPPPNTTRLQEMMRAVQQADQRIRSQMPNLEARDPDFRGVWDTLSDPNPSQVPLRESSP